MKAIALLSVLCLLVFHDTTDVPLSGNIGIFVPLLDCDERNYWSLYVKCETPIQDFWAAGNTNKTFCREAYDHAKNCSARLKGRCGKGRGQEYWEYLYEPKRSDAQRDIICSLLPTFYEAAECSVRGKAYNACMAKLFDGETNCDTVKQLVRCFKILYSPCPKHVRIVEAQWYTTWNSDTCTVNSDIE